MTIKTTQSSYVSHIKEEDLKEILEYYWKNKLNQDISIENTKHSFYSDKVGDWEETDVDITTIKFKINY